MEFYEKLSFLLHITNTNNNELAAAIGVGPSIVSLYKTGRRPMPKKSSKIRKLAQFFGVQVLNKYQRQALADKMENNIILTHYQPIDIEEAIFCWFTDHKMPSDSSTQRLVMAMSNPSPIIPSSSSAIAPERQTTRIYSGLNGKAEAVRDFFAHALSMEHPATIYLHGDDDREWFYKDPTLDATICSAVSTLIKRGFIIKQILPPTNNEFLLDVFSKWIPFYLTGAVIPYYYPRYRDQLFRGFQFAIENEIGAISYGILHGRAPGFASIVTEPQLVNDISETVKDLLRVSLPALTIHKEPIEAFNAFKKFQAIPTTQLSFRNSLPPELSAKQDFETLCRKYTNLSFESIQQSMALYASSLKDNIHIDIVKVANAKQVRSGKVKMIVPGIPISEWTTYTPASYSRHLRNVINKLETNDNYYLAPIPYDLNSDNAIFIREKTTALLFNYNPFTTYEVKAPELVSALEETLLRKIDNIYYKDSGKKQIIKQLQDIVTELKH